MRIIVAKVSVLALTTISNYFLLHCEQFECSIIFIGINNTYLTVLCLLIMVAKSKFCLCCKKGTDSIN